MVDGIDIGHQIFDRYGLCLKLNSPEYLSEYMIPFPNYTTNCQETPMLSLTFLVNPTYFLLIVSLVGKKLGRYVCTHYPRQLTVGIECP